MRLLMAAGGTGGHVIPAITIAQAAKGIDASTEILFVGTPRGFETRLVPQAGFKLETISIKGMNRVGLWRRIQSLVLLPQAFWKSWKILRSFSPTVVFGIGGYASGPILLLASFGKSKTALLEPNAVPGFANRVLSRFVDQFFVGFEETVRALPKRKCVWTGNPIRKEVLAVVPPTYEGPRRKILIFGGSQGAGALNQAVVDVLPNLVAYRDRLSFIHQTGEVDVERVRDAYREHGLSAEVQPYFDDMARVYQESDLVIARSGSSVLEIAATGRPAILVPFPYAADDHQAWNARVLVNVKAAFCIEEDNELSAHIVRLLVDLLKHPERLQEMSRAALSLRKNDPAKAIAQSLFEMASDERRAA